MGESCGAGSTCWRRSTVTSVTLRTKLASGAGGGVDRYGEARARRMTALAAVEELRLKRIHGELHHGRDVEFVMTQMLTALKSRLLSLPSRCAPYLVGKTNVAEIAETIRRRSRPLTRNTWPRSEPRNRPLLRAWPCRLRHAQVLYK
jgi:hypothetical protein